MQDWCTQLVTRLIGDAPALAPRLEDHLVDNGELLPHVFMGDVTRFVCNGMDVGDEGAAIRIVQMLEEAMCH